MIKYIYTVVKSNNPNLFFFKILLILAIIIVLFYLYKVSAPPKENQEGFLQEAPFILKQNANIYDEFYAEVYDGISERDKTCQKELYEIIKMTEPDTKNSVFLDVGTGTGTVLNELVDAGYNAYGIDKSESMIELSEIKYPNLSIVNEDVLDSMAFEKGVFTHVLCTNFTIYEIKEKSIFFRNCYNWMKPNSYLILHLVDREKFSAKKFNDSIMDLTSAFKNLYSPVKDNKRKLQTSVEFSDFKYNAEFVIDTYPMVVLKETFTDKQTENIRQNENALYMEKLEDILAIASKCGFIIHGKTNMKLCNGDENQYLYVLERTL